MSDQPNGKKRKQANFGLLPSRFIKFDKDKPQQPQTDSYTEEAHYSSSDPVSVSVKRATWVIAAATMISLGVGTLQWCALHSTDNKIGRQLTLLENDQRPWVNFASFTFVEGLIFNLNARGWHTRVRLIAKNGGKTPARFVKIAPFPALFPNGSRELSTIMAELKSSCINTENEGQLLSPGDLTWPYETSAVLKMSDLERAKRRSEKTAILIFSACLDYRSPLRPTVANPTNFVFSRDLGAISQFDFVEGQRPIAISETLLKTPLWNIHPVGWFDSGQANETDQH